MPPYDTQPVDNDSLRPDYTSAHTATSIPISGCGHQSIICPLSTPNSSPSPPPAMKLIGGKREKVIEPSTSLLPSSVPQYTVTFHSGTAAAHSEQRYVPEATVPRPAVFHSAPNIAMPPAEEPALPFHDTTGDTPDAIPTYETTKPCDEKGSTKTRQNVAHMDELKSQQGVFLEMLPSRYHDPLVLTPCSCDDTRVRKVGCSDCIQPVLLCPQCWLNKHRTLPTHWALIWNTKDHFFEKHDFCRVMKNGSIAIGHHGQRCPQAGLGRSFTLVDMNGIHATILTFFRCNNEEGQCGASDFQQLLKAGIFPGSVKDPKTGYTLAVLEYFRQLRSQGKGSAYNFVCVLSRMADPIFSGSVPDIYINFLAVSRFYEYLYIIMDRGHAHMPDVPLPGEVDRPYPNRPREYLGQNCGACPERGVNMPLIVNVPCYLRHLISQHLTLDGNFKANLFFKRDDGSDKARTDGTMYFPVQQEFERISKEYVIPDEDKEVPCKAHIGSIWHQGQVKYGNTAVSSMIACACDHAVAGSFVDMLKGEGFALGTYAQREHLKHANSPPHPPKSATPTVFSYDSFCSFIVNMVKRAIALFPDETALHTLLAARHDIINFVMDAWNTWKVLRQAELLAAERLDALHLFELHMVVVEDLSRQHAAEVPGWSRLSCKTTQSAGGKVRSIYQHESTKVITIESMLAGLDAAERERAKREAGTQPTTSVAQWIHAGMAIQCQQVLVVALLTSHREHPLQETWASITKLRDSLNVDLKTFREHQRFEVELSADPNISLPQDFLCRTSHLFGYSKRSMAREVLDLSAGDAPVNPAAYIGKNKEFPTENTPATVAAALARVFELAHTRHFHAVPQATAFLYTYQYCQLLPFTFLSRLAGNPTMNAVGLELTPEDASLFKDLHSVVSRLNAAVKASRKT
ncbi:hypothetical protein B0H17DRAFT_1202698 [Mycena rosella]|uniref:CxC2-like cysteine cluster KDZ transposase-associated domain-containing protein n=1 Tax=Mycena rosella TaxID=1033263 RepID=A0AAD7DD38_MYCRO|nr:hypothetical protein B0H17DRAFT_1202698 [Mycena rosella]